MTTCPKCNESSADGVAACEHCGALLPGALERMIDERAHAIVAQEKATNGLIVERAVKKATDRRAGRKLDEELQAASAAYDKNMSEPATMAGSVLRSVVVVAIVTFVVGVLPFGGGLAHDFLYPAIGFTPSSVLCPYVCNGCEASAHVVRSGKSNAFLCKNPAIDVTKVSFNDVGDDRLKPYVLSGHGPDAHIGWFTGCVLDALIVTPFVALLLGPLLGLRRRRRRLAERADLKNKLETLREQAGRLEASATP